MDSNLFYFKVEELQKFVNGQIDKPLFPAKDGYTLKGFVLVPTIKGIVRRVYLNAIYVDSDKNTILVSNTTKAAGCPYPPGYDTTSEIKDKLGRAKPKTKTPLKSKKKV